MKNLALVLFGTASAGVLKAATEGDAAETDQNGENFMEKADEEKNDASAEAECTAEEPESFMEKAPLKKDDKASRSHDRDQESRYQNSEYDRWSRRRDRYFDDEEDAKRDMTYGITKYYRDYYRDGDDPRGPSYGGYDAGDKRWNPRANEDDRDDRKNRDRDQKPKKGASLFQRGDQKTSTTTPTSRSDSRGADDDDSVDPTYGQSKGMWYSRRAVDYDRRLQDYDKSRIDDSQEVVNTWRRVDRSRRRREEAEKRLADDRDYNQYFDYYDTRDVDADYRRLAEDRAREAAERRRLDDDRDWRDRGSNRFSNQYQRGYGAISYNADVTGNYPVVYKAAKKASSFLGRWSHNYRRDDDVDGRYEDEENLRSNRNRLIQDQWREDADGRQIDARRGYGPGYFRSNPKARYNFRDPREYPRDYYGRYFNNDDTYGFPGQYPGISSYDGPRGYRYGPAGYSAKKNKAAKKH